MTVLQAEVVQKAKEKVDGYGYRSSLKRLDAFTGKEGVCIRPMTPQVVETYIDGSQEVLVPYTVVVRRRGPRHRRGGIPEGQHPRHAVGAASRRTELLRLARDHGRERLQEEGTMTWQT